jgi:glycosidase
MRKSVLALLILGTGLSWFGCKESAKQESESESETTYQLIDAPEWSKNANLYEVNIRQYTPEGTFDAFAEHLPRLREMGVDILWFMPIHPISEKNRKGPLGSYYAVRDYKAVNPDFGTEQDFREMVEKAHNLGMKVILDWVPNHTAFDNVWIEAHPDWYTRNEKGEIIHPKGTDWTDVADLDYDNQEMRAAMTDAMSYWITEFDIDGYRCDVAGEVPNDFWKKNNETLFKLKPVFMLAEADGPSLHEAGFHMTYNWGLHNRMNQLASGKISLAELDAFMKEDTARYGPRAYRMNFITNHDENSWNGTIGERLGDAADAMAVLAFTIDGMPLIYSGQEAGLDKRLKFFEKDTIDWGEFSKAEFYGRLLQLKNKNQALWNGIHGGKYTRINTDNNAHIFCYFREKAGHQVVVTLNLSDQEQGFSTTDLLPDAEFTRLSTGEMVNPSSWSTEPMRLEPWGYRVLSYIP